MDSMVTKKMYKQIQSVHGSSVPTVNTHDLFCIVLVMFNYIRETRDNPNIC